jgi:hypothetical protein
LRNLTVAESLKKAKRKYFRLTRLQARHSIGQGLTQEWLARTRDGMQTSGRHEIGGVFRKWNGLVGTSRSDHIQSRVDCRSPQVTLVIFKRIRVSPPAQQSHKNGLQYVFRVACIAGNPVGGPEHQAVVGPKRSLEFVGNPDCRFL